MVWCSERHGAPVAQRGMTLIELVVAIVVISVGLAGVLLVFSTTVRGSADPVVQRQMQVIAEEMLEEIALKPYAAEANAAPATCARDTYNDVSDYNGYATLLKVCTIDGSPMPSLAEYSVSVSVGAGSLGGLAGRRIEVTVSHGSQTLRMSTWRMDYAS